MPSTLVRSAFLAAASLATLAPADIVATFDSGTQGWGVYRDAKKFGWISDFGNPPGSIHATDEVSGVYWGFIAGPDFLGDRTSSIDGDLSWDIWVSGINNTDPDEPDVWLLSPNLTLVIDIGDPADDDAWIPRTVHLAHSAGWKVDTLDGPDATADQFAQAMADLKELRIRAEYYAGNDEAWLDNIVMTADDACYADCDGNGTLDLFDFLCFQNAFVGQADYGDCEDNNLFDLFNFLCYQNAFVNGC